jgi:hypothetical protein
MGQSLQPQGSTPSLIMMDHISRTLAGGADFLKMAVVFKDIPRGALEEEVLTFKEVPLIAVDMV